MTVVYTDLAQPLLDYVSRMKADTSGTSSSLNVNLTLSADHYGTDPRILTAIYGFEGYMGVPGLDGTDSKARLAAYENNVAWEALDPALNAPSRAYYSAVSVAAFAATYGVTALRADTIPVVFSHPVLGNTVHASDFRVTLNTGEIVIPLAASFLPNYEFNERQTVVITGHWGNRIAPGGFGAQYPVNVAIVDDGSPLHLITPAGLFSAVGMNAASLSPYSEGNGPRILAAKLSAFSDLGEGGPAWLSAGAANSGADLYGDQALYRLRLYTSAGFSPDGIASIDPDDFSKFFQLRALDQSDEEVVLLHSGVDYTISGFGKIRILGIADTGSPQESYDATYVEDHDNQYDIIITGDRTAVERLTSIRMPSGNSYSPVYNPGGPGNDPASNPPAPFTVPSSDQTVEISNDFLTSSFVTYVEIDGSVVKSASTGQPIGATQGLAVHDISTSHKINKYLDPDGKIFYSSFDVDPTYQLFLTDAAPNNYSRATNDHFFGSSGINNVNFLGARSEYFISGSLAELVTLDLVAFRDAEDRLHDIERLTFSDGTLAFDVDGNAGQAFRLYQAALGRAPDSPGLGYWVSELDRGLGDLTWAARNFLLSVEFNEIFGDPWEKNDLEFLELLYQIAFDRQPDEPGLEYWLAELANGGSREMVVASFSESLENQMNLMDAVASGIWFI